MLASLLLLLAPVLSLGVLPVAAADPSTAVVAPVTVFHRHLSPSSTAAALPEWTPRLAIHLAEASNGALPVVSRIEDLLADEGQALAGDGEGWYQVSLEGSEAFTSVRACYHDLPAAVKQEVFTLHLSPPATSSSSSAGASPVYHVDYALGGIARDGSCPSRSTASKQAGKKGAVVVKLASADRPTPLILGAPPPVDASTGMPVAPVPEKTFIQKYWMYMAIPVVLMLILPEPAADAPAAK